MLRCGVAGLLRGRDRLVPPYALGGIPVPPVGEEGECLAESLHFVDPLFDPLSRTGGRARTQSVIDSRPIR